MAYIQLSQHYWDSILCLCINIFFYVIYMHQPNNAQYFKEWTEGVSDGSK